MAKGACSTMVLKMLLQMALNRVRLERTTPSAPGAEAQKPRGRGCPRGGCSDPRTHSLVLAAVLQNGSIKVRFWSAVSFRDKRRRRSVSAGCCLRHSRPAGAAPHLVCGRRRQLAHVDVQDVQLQPAGGLAAGLQELSRQQLQEPGNDTDRDTRDYRRRGGGGAGGGGLRGLSAVTCCPSWSSSASGRFV